MVTSPAGGPVVTSACGDSVVMSGSVVDSTSAEFVLKKSRNESRLLLENEDYPCLPYSP